MAGCRGVRRAGGASSLEPRADGRRSVLGGPGTEACGSGGNQRAAGFHGGLQAGGSVLPDLRHHTRAAIFDARIPSPNLDRVEEGPQRWTERTLPPFTWVFPA